MTDLVEQLQQIGIVDLTPEMGFEEVVNSTLKNASVVYGDVVDLSEALDIRDAVPTRLTAAGDGPVHNVIMDE